MVSTWHVKNPVQPPLQPIRLNTPPKLALPRGIETAADYCSNTMKAAGHFWRIRLFPWPTTRQSTHCVAIYCGAKAVMACTHTGRAISATHSHHRRKLPQAGGQSTGLAKANRPRRHHSLGISGTPWANGLKSIAPRWTVTSRRSLMKSLESTFEVRFIVGKKKPKSRQTNWRFINVKTRVYFLIFFLFSSYHDVPFS